MAFISEAGLRQSREKRLSFRDLGHFRRRSESFERGGENCVPFDGAAGRLVEPRQRQRRAQFETARTLLLRDRDSGQKRFLGSRGVGRVTLQQHLATDAMQLGVELAISDVLARVITLSWAASWSFFQADPATADSDSSMRVKAGP